MEQSLKEMVAERNELASRLGLPPVKGYSDKKKAAEALKKLRAKLTPPKNVSHLCARLASEDRTADEIVAEARKQFPDSKVTRASAAWFRSAVKRGRYAVQ